MTAEDAVFSLKRAADPKGGGFYAAVFDRVKSIEATGEKTLKITLTQPDYWLLGELSSTPGEIVQKKYAEAKGKDFGTVSGGTMCSGPFKLDSWQTGKGVKMVPNPDYWDTSLPKPKLTSLTLIGVPDDATLTAGIKTGAITGGYAIALTTFAQLETDPNVKVYQGAPFDSPRPWSSARPRARSPIPRCARRCPSRSTARASSTRSGRAPATSRTRCRPPARGAPRRTSSRQAYDALPALDQDMAKAQDLIKQADVAGQNITIGTPRRHPALNSEALAFKAAAEAIGLKVTLQNVSPSNYINYFIDPKAWGSVDAFATTNYGDYADPAGLYKTMALPRVGRRTSATGRTPT